MNNEKYLNYYIETLTATLTDCVVRNVSLQANAKVTEKNWSAAEQLYLAAKKPEQAVKMYADAAEEELEWARYLFKEGTMIGMNSEI